MVPMRMWNGYVLTLIPWRPSLNISMDRDYEETISVEQLFQKELEALRDQYDALILKGTPVSLEAAENLEHVIRYFESRLNQTTELYIEGGPGPEDLLH